jgi:uncharacterized membrane protein
MNKEIGLVWGLIFLAMVGYLMFIEDSLPERLAVHFDIAGNPNGFQSKSTFITTFFCFIFFLNGLFLALFFLIDRLPSQKINIPWKDYWFANEERKVVAFEKLRAVMGLVGIFLCVVFLITEHIIYQANTTNPWFTFPINGGVIIILALSLLLLALSFTITKPPTEGN